MVSMKDTITEGDDNFYSRRETILSGPRGPYPHDPPWVTSQETSGTDGEFAEGETSVAGVSRGRGQRRLRPFRDLPRIIRYRRGDKSVRNG